MSELPEVRDAVPGEIPDMLAVIQAAFPRWPLIEVDASPLEHLRWKMRDGSVDGPKHTVALIDGQIVATRLRWENRIDLDGREHRLETGADFAVHPDYQGRGLSRLVREHFHQRLIEHPRPGISMPSRSPQVRYMTSDSLIGRPLTVWFRPFGARAFAAAVRTASPSNLWKSARSTVGHRRAVTDVERTEVLVEFDGRVDDLWNRARGAFDIIASRRSAYLNWRFARPESGNPEILALIGDGRLSAYGVLKRSGREANLVDLLWDPAVPDALPAIVAASVERCRGEGIRGVTCWLPSGHLAEPALRRNGFIAVGHDEVLLGNGDAGETSAEVLAIFEDPGRTMHITMSDFDYF